MVFKRFSLQNHAGLQIYGDVMDANYSYDNQENEDVPYVQMELDIRDVKQVYTSLKYHSERWYGQDTEEKENIDSLKDFFYRMILEYNYQFD